MSRPPLPEDLNAASLAGLYSLLAGPGQIRRLLELARDEDLGSTGDLTSVAMAIQGDATARLVLRQPGVVCGLRAITELAATFGFEGEVATAADDGDRLDARARLATFRGPAATLLALERTMLNLVGRLSGVATRTAAFVAELAAGAPGSTARLFDTRKTTPGLRALEKYAVRCGGGYCHRLGLYDAVLIKDNHLAGLSGDTLGQRIAEAADRARRNAAGGRTLRFVEVEVDRLDQLHEVLDLPDGLIDIVLLDNMDLTQLREAVRLRDDRSPGLLLEASGGVRLDTVAPIARTGVDRISVGSLTHGATALDVALDFEGPCHG